MNKYIVLILNCLAAVVLSARADTSIVFNEIMYHPATNEPAMEWVELYNQMAVDVDMSKWSLDGDIHYTFGTNVVVHGGAFVVVSISPTNLAAVTGLTNILGPFTNRLSNSGGHLLLRNNNGRIVNKVDYGTSGDWPVAPDGAGVSLAKLDHSTGSDLPGYWAPSAQMGGTPGRENFPTNPVVVPLAFNEVSATTNTDYWLELMNYGTNTLAVNGYVIVYDGTNNAEYALPPGTTLPARGFLVLSNTTLGFHPVSGDKLYLLPPTRTNVMDAVLLKSGARARSPDGTGAWLRPTTLTPGGTNQFVFHNEIVINEIMYHHQLLPATNVLVPGPSSSEAWLELYNRSTNTVDLTGWTIGGGISYDFPAGKTMAPHAYLVVANNSVGLRASYPSIDIVGDYSGKLSHSGDTITLQDPAGNPANSVSYYVGGRWSDTAGGGGSSLELMDPYADNSKPGAWAASDESGKTSWQTYSYQALGTNAVGTAQWNDFILGLLTDGECLVDDISVLESPGASQVQFIANGNFESGATGWRFLGNHMQSRVEPEPGNPSNHMLHVIAGGVQSDQQDHVEATFTGSHTVNPAKTYQISFRARWLSGNNLLNTRLYYDRVARTTALPVPVLNGTPGAQNSRYATNIGPTFSQFQHKPAVPAVSQAVTVSALAQDPQGVSTCEVWWSANGAAFSHAAMTNQGGGLYTGSIPGFSAGTIVQFYVRGVDGLGAVSTYPAAGANSGALYMVNDGQANFSQGHNLRVILSPASWSLLRAPTNLLGQAFLPCTMIYDEQRPYYDLLVRLKGSALGRVNDPHPSFHMEFQPDDLFRGVHSSMLIDTSGRGGGVNPQEQIVVNHMNLHAGGIPDIHPDMCRVIPPYLTNTTQGVLMPRFEDEFITTAYPNGDNGTEFAMEIDYYPTTANAAGYKLPSPQSLWGTFSQGLDIKDLGDSKECYRYNFMIKNHRNEDDFSRLIPFCKTLWLPNTPILDAQSKQVMDVDEWLRMFAMVSLVGEGDWYTFGQWPHNTLLYIRPDNNRVLAFPNDVEQLFLQSPTASLVGGSASDWKDLEDQFPGNTRRLYAHALDIISTTFNTNYMTYWARHYASFAPGSDFSDLLTWIPQRTAGVLAEISGAGGNTAFSVSATNFTLSTSNVVTLSGNAPVQVQSLLINGVAYPITWTSVSHWTISVPVNSPTNVLSITAFDLNGKPLTNDNRTVIVNYTGAAPNPVGTVVINEIMYNPLLPGASYVELRNRSTTVSFDLSNWRVNGLGYTFPTGSLLGPGQFLVLVQDQSAFINAYGPALPPFDEFPGNLQTDGETLTLTMPAAQTNLADVVVDKVKYSASAPWPATTPGVSLQLKDSAQDHFRVGNWGAAAGTPIASNSVSATLTPFPPLWINELQADNLTGITNSAGQRTPWLELYNPSTNKVFCTNLYLAKTYTNLTAWAFPTGVVINPGQFKVIFADSQTGLSTTNEPHTSFTLPSGAGSLALSRIANSQTQVLDYVDYTNLTPNNSYGSFPDGQSFDRQEFFYVTPGGTNNGTSAPLTVRFNEWMAGNTHTLTNPLSGKYSDWFELYNYGTNPANLAGYYLTDNLTNQLQFQIPAGYTIPPHGFLLVWADGKDTNGTADLHVTFKLSKSGESLGLYGNDGNPVDFVNYGAQTDDVSEGRYPDGAAPRYFMTTATPRTNNIIANTAPALGTFSNWLVQAGQTVSFTATATDAESPPQTLTFSLDPGAPAGASINPSTGAFAWDTTGALVPSTNNITVRVTDNGTPPLNAAGTFSVTVLPVPPTIIVQPGNQTNFLGGSASFSVTADGSSPLFYHWQFNSADIAGQTNANLSLDCLNPTNQGNYRVRVFNAGGATNSPSATLTVVVPSASWVSYSNPGQVYTQAFDSLPNPGANAVDANNPVVINGTTYALANPFDFAFPASPCGANPGGLDLGDTLPGWYGLGSGAAEFGAGAGGQSAGGVISFGLTNSPGASTNRALGLLATSPSGRTAFGVKFVNQTTSTLARINLHFTGELWRQSAVAKTLAVAYWIDATATNAFSTNITAALPGLNVSFPTNPAAVTPVPMDGTASSNQTSLGVISQTISNWPPNAAVWLRWEMNDPAAAGQGLAIDNLSFSALTAPSNTAPALGALSNWVVQAGQTVSFTASATDTDQPPQTLTFTLDPGVPAGASINPITGAFTWTTTNAVVPSTNNITVRVTDNGTPPLSATGAVSIAVVPIPPLIINQPVSQTNFIGGSAAFTVGAGGSPTLAYQWQFNHVDMAGQTASGLSLNCLSATNQGNYRVRVTNGAGPTNSQDATLTVIVPAASWIPYVNPGDVYTQAFDSLPNPGTSSVDAGNPVVISGVNYALSNPLEFAFPPSSCGSAPGGLGLGDTLAGWYGLAGVQARFGASAGDRNNGGLISFGLTNSPGASANRALGLLATSPSGAMAFGVKFINQSTNTLNQVTLHFTGELWRQSAVAKTLAVSYWIDSTATNTLSTNITAALPGLNVSFPTNPAATTPIPMDGTAFSNQVNLGLTNQTITNWPPATALWLVWRMVDTAANGQGLGIDDLRFSASTAVPNTAPVLTALDDKFVYGGQTVHFTASATDTDQPPQTLSFSLDPGAPADASIDPTAGLFTWTTTNAAVPSTNSITIRVTDNGSPPLSASTVFLVTVYPLPQLSVSRPAGSNFPLSFGTLTGQTYQVLYKTNLTDQSWTPLSSPMPGTGGVLEVDDDMTGQSQRFYQLVVPPPP